MIAQTAAPRQFNPFFSAFLVKRLLEKFLPLQSWVADHNTRTYVHTTKPHYPQLLKNIMSENWNINSIHKVEHGANLRIVRP
jgi:hypothetical protein